MLNKVAVITPYYKESNEILRMCHESVLHQTPQTDHILVADGHPNPLIEDWSCKHIILPHSHGDNGNTPRGIGALMALAEGYQFIAFLDADNWYHKDHIASLLSLYEDTSSPICCSMRTYHSLEGLILNAKEIDEDNLTHVDTSCIMLHKNASKLATIWALMPKNLSPICDRIFLAASKHFNLQMSSTKTRSVAFRSQYIDHYLQAGIQPPEDLKGLEEVEPAINYLFTKEGIDDCQRMMNFWPGTYLPKNWIPKKAR